MAKRTLIQGGFALPGLAKDPGKAFGFRERRSRKSAEETSSSTTSKTSTNATLKQNTNSISNDYSDDSTSLVDDTGAFLSPKKGARLEHLTKSRPRSPRRRSGQRNGERSRSRSPTTLNGDDTFDYGMGLAELDYSFDDLKDRTLPEGKLTNSSADESKCANSSPRSSSLNDNFAKDVDLSKLEEVLTTTSRRSNCNQKSFEAEASVPKVVMDSNASPGRDHEKSSFELKLDLDGVSPEQYSSCSDDIGDMLMGDFVDSDLEPEQPQLPTRPPPLEEEIEIVQIEKHSRTIDHRSDEISSRTSRDLDLEHGSAGIISSKQTNPLSTNKYFPPLGNFDRQTSLPERNLSSIGSSTKDVREPSKLFSKLESDSFEAHDIITRGNNKPELSADGVKLTSPYGTRVSKFGDNPSSTRRRRFKPVSLDLESDTADADSNKLLQTLPDTGTNNTSARSDSLNKTFPRAFSGKSDFDSSGEKKREIDWGLGSGALNSSFSESSLKSGTIFDRYLMKKEQRLQKQQEGNAQQQQNAEAQYSTLLKKQEPMTSPAILGNSYSKTHSKDFSTKTSGYNSQEEVIIARNKQELKEHFRNDNDEEKLNEENIRFDNKEETVQNNDNMIDDDMVYDVDDAADDADVHSADDADSTDDESAVYVPSFDNNAQLSDAISNSDRLYGNDCISKSDNDKHNDYLFDNDDGEISDDVDDIVEPDPPRIQPSIEQTVENGNQPCVYSGKRKPVEYINSNWDHDMNGGNLQESDHHFENISENTMRGKISYDFRGDVNTGLDIHNQYDGDGDGNIIVSNDYYHRDDDDDGERSDDGDASYISDEGSNLGDYVDDTVVQGPDDVDRDEEFDPPHEFAAEEEATANDSLFQPPPMFASDDEELDDPDLMHIQPPMMEADYSIVKPKKVMPFHKIPLGDWTEEDAREWLDYVGLGHFKKQFKVHHVNGRTLKNINFQLLEEIGISSPDEREIVLSEIYELDNPSEDEQLESEIQDALETATEQDKEKILAVLTALRSPTLSGHVDLATPSTGSSSPRDSDPGYHLSSDTNSLASSVTASDDLSHRGSAEVTPSHSLKYSPLAYQQASVAEKEKMRSSKPQENIKDEKKTKEKKKRKNKKDKKRISKFWESLSLSHTSSKLNKLFGSKKLNPSMQYLLQAGPQGIVRVWPVSLTGQTKYCSFMVCMTTKSAQVVRMVIEKFDIVADPLRYYLCEVGTGKRGVNRALEETDCPLLLQCRWPDPEKYHFELRCLDEGVVRMLFELEGYEEDLDYRSIGVSTRTPCTDVLPLIVRKYDLPGEVEEYQLIEVSEENEDVRQVVAGHVCPLKLQKAWDEPDHVFRLVRVQPLASNQPRVPPPVPDEPPLEPQYAPAVESSGPGYPPVIPTLDVKYSAGTSSEASSVRGGYESTDSTDHVITDDHTTSEENFTFQSLAETNKELDEMVLEVQDQMTAPDGGLARSRGQSASIETQLVELRETKAYLAIKEQEIAALKEENADLLEKEKELEIWRMRNKELVEREEEVEEFKTEQERILQQLQDVREKEGLELQLRDREIERLYARNNELNEKEKEYEEIKRKMTDYTQMEETLEHLQRVNRDAVAKQNEMAKERDDLQRHYQNLEGEMRDLQSGKRGRDMTGDTTELDALRQKLAVSENERREAVAKLEEVQRRSVLLERSAQLLETLRRENEALAAKVRDSDEMRKNIIKLTTQLREADKLRLNQGELDDLKLNLSIINAEKQQLQTRVEEVERSNLRERSDLRESVKEVGRLRKDNAGLRAQVEEFKDIRHTVVELKTELNEAEALRHKFTTIQDVEKSLKSDVQAKTKEIKQMSRRIEELERKLTKTTDALTKMRRESQAQEEQRENLNRLLTIIKDKDPSLLQTLHRSLADGKQADEEDEEEEEWC